MTPTPSFGGSLDSGPVPTIASLVDELDDSFVIPWRKLRGFADWARRRPDDLARAVREAPTRRSRLVDAIVASFVELVCAEYGLAAPSWTKDVPALDDPWEPEGTPRMLERARLDTPVQFRARKLTVARSDLVRDRRPA